MSINNTANKAKTVELSVDKPVVLTIAGNDSAGMAGIAMDVRTYLRNNTAWNLPALGSFYDPPNQSGECHCIILCFIGVYRYLISGG